MLRNIILISITFLSAIIFLLAPGDLWIIGMGLIFLIWLVYLILVIPGKPLDRRGWWVVVACYILIAGLITSAVMRYLYLNNKTVRLAAESLESIAYVGERIFSGAIGLSASLIVTFVFLFTVGYFSSLYVTAIDEDEVPFWDAFRSFVYLILNMQLAWLIVENGEIKEVKKKGYFNKWLSRGKIIVKPGNAIVLEKGGQITRIHGSGVVITVKDEFIRHVFDLRPQFAIQELDNVITADHIPLEIEFGIGYRITPTNNITRENVFSEKKFGLFPVREDTILKAAFNGTAGGWVGFAQGAPVSLLRDQIMAHRFDEIFEIRTDDDDITIRANERRVKLIENTILGAINSFADEAMGITITGIDVREITLPDDIRDAINMGIKTQAEAEAIRQIEGERNTARGQMVTAILDSIAEKTNSIGVDELEWATTFAQITRRALTDDILGHQYVEMLKALAEGNATKIFNATPSDSAIEPKQFPIPMPRNIKNNGHTEGTNGK